VKSSRSTSPQITEDIPTAVYPGKASTDARGRDRVVCVQVGENPIDIRERFREFGRRSWIDMVRNVETAAENRPVYSVLSYVRESTTDDDSIRFGVRLPVVHHMHHPVISFLRKLRIGKEDGPELSSKFALAQLRC
jgi:hypothetical protein